MEEEKDEGRNRHREKSHDHKKAMTKAHAIREMHSLADRRDIWMAAYPCDFCDWWHVGEYTKIAERIGLKPRDYSHLGKQKVIPIAQGISGAVGEVEKKLRKLYPETPMSHWNEHLRLCAKCADTFWRGRRLCDRGALLYHHALAWNARQEVKRKRQGG